MYICVYFGGVVLRSSSKSVTVICSSIVCHGAFVDLDLWPADFDMASQVLLVVETCVAKLCRFVLES